MSLMSPSCLTSKSLVLWSEKLDCFGAQCGTHAVLFPLPRRFGWTHFYNTFYVKMVKAPKNPIFEAMCTRTCRQCSHCPLHAHI